MPGPAGMAGAAGDGADFRVSGPRGSVARHEPRDRFMRCTVLAALVLLALGSSLPPAARAVEPAVAVKADRVLVWKAKRKLYLLRDGRVLHRYRVALGREPEGPKRREGDGRTPEGVYRLDWRNPDSRFHRSIHISYPNEDERTRAARRGIDPGGQIMLHGLPDKLEDFEEIHRRRDWTEGCIAVTNDEMDEIWALVEDGTVIEIRP